MAPKLWWISWKVRFSGPQENRSFPLCLNKHLQSPIQDNTTGNNLFWAWQPDCLSWYLPFWYLFSITTYCTLLIISLVAFLFPWQPTLPFASLSYQHLFPWQPTLPFASIPTSSCFHDNLHSPSHHFSSSICFHDNLIHSPSYHFPSSISLFITTSPPLRITSPTASVSMTTYAPLRITSLAAPLFPWKLTLPFASLP